jgi:hypothetical protein
MLGWVRRRAFIRLKGYSWDECVSWLTICFWYGISPDGPYGSMWVADAQFVYLGGFALLNAEERADAVRKATEESSDGEGAA